MLENEPSGARELLLTERVNEQMKTALIVIQTAQLSCTAATALSPSVPPCCAVSTAVTITSHHAAQRRASSDILLQTSPTALLSLLSSCAQPLALSISPLSIQPVDSSTHSFEYNAL